jgi:lipopolysaccharide transport system permease protein
MAFTLRRPPAPTPEVEAAVGSRGTVVIEPRREGPIERFREVGRYRALLPFFGRRALEKLYIRTHLGWLWIPARPLLDVGLKALIFGGLLGAPSGDVPYFLFFLIGMMGWTLFEQSLMWATRSIELNRALIKKLYFPRLILPFANLAPALVELVLYSIILSVALVVFKVIDGTTHIALEPRLILAPVGLMLGVLLALGISFWTAVLGASTRDMRFTLSYVLGVWFFLTPVIYPLGSLPAVLQPFAVINPMTPIIEMVKWASIGVGEVNLPGLALSAGMIVLAWGSGLWFFSRAEALSVDQM